MAEVKTAKWWPGEHVDEVMPPARESPDTWLVKLDSGHGIAHAEDDDGQPPPRKLLDGELVAFWQEHEFGGAKLTWHGKGEFQLSRPMPAEAEQVCIPGDMDAMAATIDGLVEYLNENDYDPDEFDVEYYAFSTDTFKYSAATGTFEKLERPQ